MKYLSFDEFRKDLEQGKVAIIFPEEMDEQTLEAISAVQLYNEFGMSLAKYLSTETEEERETKNIPLTLDGGWWYRDFRKKEEVVPVNEVLELFNKDTSDELKAILSF